TRTAHSATNAATRLTTDSRASDKKPTDPVTAAASTLSTIVAAAAPTESSIRRTSRPCSADRSRVTDPPVALSGAAELAQHASRAGSRVDALLGDDDTVHERRRVAARADLEAPGAVREVVGVAGLLAGDGVDVEDVDV